MWTPYQLFIACGMVATGSINTLATKWADLQSAPGPDGTVHEFDHPFLQAVGMFVGEFSCLIVFKIWFYIHRHNCCRRSMDQINTHNQDFSPLLLLPPAMCDMIGTSLMYVGLNFTFASSFQMLRGAVIVFTALLSVAFLRRVIERKAWVGIVFVIAGLAIVGAADIIFVGADSKYKPMEILTGDLIIMMAQIVAAVQMVVEEKFINGKDIHPLQAVGWEGFFGMTVLGLLLIPMYYIPAGSFGDNPRGVIEDAWDGLYQLGQNGTLAFAQFGSICSIAFFNFFGISVTKELSATTRMVLDSIRTLVIWAVSIGVGWEDFIYLQVIGFVLLLTGTGVYNNIIPVPCLGRVTSSYDVINHRDDDEGAAAGETSPLLRRSQKKDDFFGDVDPFSSEA